MDECRHCGTLNQRNASKCSSCGIMLHHDVPNEAQAPVATENETTAEISVGLRRRGLLLQGIALLLLGTTILFGGIAVITYENISKKAYVADAAWQKELPHANRTHNYNELNRIEDVHKKKAIRPSLALALLFTCIGLGFGKPAARKHEFPPILYMLVTGILPGCMIFWGWRRFHLSATPETAMIDDTAS